MASKDKSIHDRMQTSNGKISWSEGVMISSKKFCSPRTFFLFIESDMGIELVPIMPGSNLQVAEVCIGVDKCIDNGCAELQRQEESPKLASM